MLIFNHFEWSWGLPTWVCFTTSGPECQHLAGPSRLSLCWIFASSHVLELEIHQQLWYWLFVGLFRHQNSLTNLKCRLLKQNHYHHIIVLYSPGVPTMSKNPIQGFSLGDERVSSNWPHVPSPLGRHWITLNRILHGMKGEKDLKPWCFSPMKAHTGTWRTWNMREERETVGGKAFMILITKIHNPPSLLFWLRRTFPLRDNNQKKERDAETEREGGNYWRRLRKTKPPFGMQFTAERASQAPY